MITTERLIEIRTFLDKECELFQNDKNISNLEMKEEIILLFDMLIKESISAGD